LITDNELSFSLPLTFVELDVQPIDSHVRDWVDSVGGREVGFDYGQWSNDLTWDPRGYYTDTCLTLVDGYEVRMLGQVEETGWRVAATWRNVTPGIHLTMGAVVSDSADVPEMIAIFRSVDFAFAE
jgi:hypothetical protein